MDGWREASGPLPPSSSEGGARGGGGEEEETEWLVSDESVMRTNDDATSAKLSCVERGYFEDGFVGHFVRQRGGRAARRSPLVNRGYYARYAAVRRIVREFFAACGQQGGAGGVGGCQVINLGAGFDTLYFSLKAAGEWPAGARMCELDFADVAHRKASVVRRQAALAALVQAEDGRGDGVAALRAADYTLVGVDLRDAGAVNRAVFERAGFEAGAPTLVISECVLIYLPPEKSDALVAWARQAFASAVMVVYEQIRPHDSFGRQMVQNIHDRGCPLLGIHAYPELADQERRFRGAGWTGAVGLDMNAVYRHKLDPTDVRRIERLEIFDEFEEWNLIQAHYCIVVATVGGKGEGEGEGGGGGGPSWGSLSWFSKIN